MSSFICMTDSTSGEGRADGAKSTSTRSSSPFPTRLFHSTWVGLWKGCLAHDLPLNFRSGVRSGAPLVANIHWNISFKRPYPSLANLDPNFPRSLSACGCAVRNLQRLLDFRAVAALFVTLHFVR